MPRRPSSKTIRKAGFLTTGPLANDWSKHLKGWRTAVGLDPAATQFAHPGSTQGQLAARFLERHHQDRRAVLVEVLYGMRFPV
jgi:hypothetical protein